MTDFHKVDLNLLRVFQVILEERGLTRAGQRLGLSQPAVSYSLGRLRALFDDPLFIRTPDGMLPTPRAEQLAAPHPEARFGTVLQGLVFLLTHFALHRGQMSYIKKLLGK